MNAAPTRTFTRLAIAMVIAAVVVSASVLSYASFVSTITRTSTSTHVNTSTLLQATTMSTTITVTSPGIQSTTYYTPPQNGQRVTVLNSVWNFTASLNTGEVARAQSIFATASLTNISPTNQTISELLQPAIDMSVYASNGSLVWSLVPPQPLWPNDTVGKGQSPSEFVSIPTSSLSIGQSYLVRIFPASIPTASNMTITMRFILTSGSAIAPSNVVFLLDVNGTWYWADNISNDIVIGAPGYSYFLNESVIFDGVTFQTICPPIYRDCPGSNSSSTIVLAGAIQFKMTFPDGTNETVGDVIGDSNYLYVLSQNTSPKAGMLIEYVGDYAHGNSIDYAVFLLVSSCGGPPHLC